MTKRKRKPATAAEAVRQAIDREVAARPDLKPIEIVKTGICAYQAYYYDVEMHHDSAHAPDTVRMAEAPASRTGTMADVAGPVHEPVSPDERSGHDAAAPSKRPFAKAPESRPAPAIARPGRSPSDASSPAATCEPARKIRLVESDDRAAFRRGTQAAVDRALFNVNYWRSAYEDRIVDACENPADARRLLASICAWNSHTMRLNRLSTDQAKQMFERFCPPFSENKRKGSAASAKGGKGPIPDFQKAAAEVAAEEGTEAAGKLALIVRDVQAEARVYRGFDGAPALEAFHELLPVWCLQDRIELVHGSWWDDASVMGEIAGALHRRFLQLGFAESVCQYHLDSFNEALDAYDRDIATSWDEWRERDTASLLALVRQAREQQRSSHHDFETEGYGTALPAWLSSKEQLIWNTVVCALYGPKQARPFLPETAAAMIEDTPEGLDVLTDMARQAYGNYLLGSADSDWTKGAAPHFEDQPEDLQASTLAQVESFHDKLAVLGYHIVPAASCYPEQHIDAFTPSEAECLAVLEHRRWLAERRAAGWELAPVKDVEAKRSPYLVPWEELPERARECNRRAVRNIPSLLASVGLAISR